jgi:hypothetical protein
MTPTTIKHRMTVDTDEMWFVLDGLNCLLATGTLTAEELESVRVVRDRFAELLKGLLPEVTR